MKFGGNGPNDSIGTGNALVPNSQQAITWIKEDEDLKYYKVTRLQWVNSLAPGRFGFDYKDAIFNLALLTGIMISQYWYR